MAAVGMEMVGEVEAKEMQAAAKVAGGMEMLVVA